MRAEEKGGGLERSLTLRGALTLNLLDMIGVGPFLTLPLLLAAMGGPQAMLGWLLGAGLAVCDGLTWAELGAALPEAGGTYAYLGAMFPPRVARWLQFVFVFQLCLSAPLSVASGCIGLAQYAGYLRPGLVAGTVVRAVHVGPYRFGVEVGWGTLVALGAVGLATWLLYRRLAAVKGLGVGLLVVVLGTIGWAVVTGLLHGHWGQVVAFPAGAWRLDAGFFTGLGSAMLIATYDYWGYYNVSFLGGEVREPGRVIPRAVLLSIGVVAVLYLALNSSVLAVMGAPRMMAAAGDVGARRALLAEFMQVAYGPSMGTSAAAMLGKVAAVLVMVTAFGSVFSLLLGYSRIPFAAARDGNFIRAFGRLHPTKRFPYVSLLALAAMACGFCFFSLGDVIAALVVLRILLQFGLQHVGVMMLRKRRPELVRPFRIWMYPMPPVLALLGFGYVVVSRPNFGREVLLAVVVAVAATAVYAVRRTSDGVGGGVV
jgi:amino acid transporter